MANVALIFPMMDYSQEVLKGIVSELDQSSSFCPVMVSFDPDHPSIIPENIEGAIGFTSTNLPWMKKFLTRGIPFINCGTDFLNYKEVLSVYIDQTRAGETAIQHFLDMDLRNVYYASYEFVNRDSSIRKAKAFVKHASSIGLNCDYLEILGENPHSHPYRWVDAAEENDLAALLEGIEKPAGIFCEDDTAALLICNVASKIGIKVPFDLAVLGYGNQLAGRFSSIPISSFPMGGERVGRLAVRLMDEWLSTGKQPEAPAPLTPLPIIVRGSTGGASQDVDMERIRRQIESNARIGISVDELAATARISRKTLISRYRDTYGETPSEAVRRIRFELACCLLSQTPPPKMAVIAGECGFSSLTSFTNFFTRQTGVAPREYREKNQKKT